MITDRAGSSLKTGHHDDFWYIDHKALTGLCLFASIQGITVVAVQGRFLIRLAMSEPLLRRPLATRTYSIRKRAHLGCNNL